MAPAKGKGDPGPANASPGWLEIEETDNRSAGHPMSRDVLVGPARIGADLESLDRAIGPGPVPRKPENRDRTPLFRSLPANAEGQDGFLHRLRDLGGSIEGLRGPVPMFFGASTSPETPETRLISAVAVAAPTFATPRESGASERLLEGTAATQFIVPSPVGRLS